MRTRNDRQPVLRGHGQAQGGEGKSGAGGGGRGSVRQNERRPQCSWSTGWGQSCRGCRTTSSEGVPRGRQVGGARRAVRSPRDRRRHRCAPSPRGTRSWHPGHGTQLLHPHAREASFLEADRVKAALPTLLPLGTVSRLK